MNSNIFDRFELVQCAVSSSIQEQRVCPLPCVGRFVFSIDGRFAGFFRQGSTTLSTISNAGAIYDGVSVQVWKVPQDFLGVQTITCGVNLFGDDHQATQHVVQVQTQFESDGTSRRASDDWPDAYSYFDTDRDDLPCVNGDYVELKRRGIIRV